MTTATTWRKERGRETERIVAAYLRTHGWPYAEPVGAGRQGADITGVPGLAIEIKATKACQPAAWLRQAAKVADLVFGVKFVIWRPDGLGPAGIEGWPVIIRLDEFARLLNAAGYADDLGIGDDDDE